MSTDTPTDEPSIDRDAGEPPAGDIPRPELHAKLELIEAENRRLRQEYARSRRSQYRRTAIGMAAIGAISVLGAIAFPGSATVLLSLGAIGLFGGLLTYYLTPERFVAATVGEAVYGAHAANGDGLVAELGLSDQTRYVPLADDARPARLYLSQSEDEPLPTGDALESTFVVGKDGQRGLALRPVGGELFAEFERSLSGPLADEPSPLADQLADGIVEAFELAEGVDPSIAADGTRCTFGVAGSTLGRIDRFDHPVASFLAVGLAVGLDQPIEMTVLPGDERFDYRVSCDWSTETD